MKENLVSEKGRTAPSKLSWRTLRQRQVTARLTEEGIAFTVGEAAPDPEQTARLAWLADRLEPFLLPRGLRITVRALLGGRLLLDWL